MLTLYCQLTVLQYTIEEGLQLATYLIQDVIFKISYASYSLSISWILHHNDTDIPEMVVENHQCNENKRVETGKKTMSIRFLDLCIIPYLQARTRGGSEGSDKPFLMILIIYTVTMVKLKNLVLLFLYKPQDILRLVADSKRIMIHTSLHC